MSDAECRRCHEAEVVFRTGALLGLCRACMENDHIGLTAEVEVLRKENAGLRERLETALGVLW